RTNASTFASIAAASPVVLQPPLASTLPNAELNDVELFVRHALSTGNALDAAFEKQPRRAAAFLPVALSFAPAHLSCARAGPASADKVRPPTNASASFEIISMPSLDERRIAGGP